MVSLFPMKVSKCCKDSKVDLLLNPFVLFGKVSKRAESSDVFTITV